MLPGRAYKPEDILAILWKHKVLLLSLFVLCSFGGLLVSRFLPNRYQSETLVQVVPQRVPESYVQSTVTSRIEDRLASISQQIMSRTRLERIIQEFDLYADKRGTDIMEDVVQGMRGDIDIEMVGGRDPTDPVDAFRVKFTYPDARIAMRVTERLASLFIDENLRDRGSLADATNDFLNTQLVDARARLEAQDLKLRTFRERFAGKLPSQAQANMQAIQNTQLQLQALLESLARDRDRKLMLERLFNDASVESANAQNNASVPFPTEGGGAQPPASAQQQLEQARGLLAQMQLRLTPQHPDILRLKRTIGDLEKKAEQEALQEPLSPDESLSASTRQDPRETDRRTKLREMRAELESVDRQIAFKESEERRVRRQVSEYQGRLEAVPGLESDWVALTRDYDTLKRTYEELLTKSESSKVAANLERRQIGEQFRILDAARLPEKPVSPDRRRINGLSAGAGLVLALGLIGLLEYRDSSFRTEADVRTALVLPVLALIPRVATRAELRRERRRKVLFGTLSLVTFVVIGGGLTYWLKLWNYVV